jgi:hypothetical protein
MICRCCGHDNEGRDRGKCANCGFELSTQNGPASEKRSALKTRMEKPVGFKERAEFKVPPHKGEIAKFGFLIALVGLGVAIAVTSLFERSEYTAPPVERVGYQVVEPVRLTDSIATLIGSEIVYVFNDSATLALPRANVDMNLIPAGTTVSFLGSSVVPLRPAANYISQKIGQRDFDPLAVDRICVWTDLTETAYVSAPLTRLPRQSDSSQTAPVLVKLYFTPEMLRGRVDEFDIQYDIAVFTEDFGQAQLDGLVSTVAGRLAARDTGDREIKVITLFDYNAYNLGEAVTIMNRIAPLVVDSLGYSAFYLNVFSLTD